MWDIQDRRFLDEADGWRARLPSGAWASRVRDLNADGLDEVMLTSMGDQLVAIRESPVAGTSRRPLAIGTYAHRPRMWRRRASRPRAGTRSSAT